jgi:hypothetical protein
MFCVSGLVFGDTRVSVPVFMFYALGLVFDGRGALGLVFLFCATELIFDGTEGVGSRFLVLHAQTRFRRFRGRRVPFSCFARPDSFSAVPSASGPVFLFCVPGLIFGGTEGIRSRFHVMRSRTSFRRYRGRRVPFLRFALPNSFSTVPRASGPVFRFCAPGLVFGGTGGVRSCFLAFSARTHFRRFRGRRVPFSWFALSDSFSAVPGASGPVFMFCAPGLVFGGTGIVRSRFALPDSFSRVAGASGPVFLFCASGLVFGGSEDVWSNFHVLRVLTHFRRCRGRRVLFSCFALPDAFLAVPGASNPVFLFCDPILIFGDTEGVKSCFHVLRARTRFRHYRGRRVLFSRFALLDSFLAVPRASCPVFMFCAPGLFFGGSGGVGSRFAIPDSFSAVAGASGPVFLICASGLIFGGSEDVRSSFHVLRARTHFWWYRGRQVSFSCFACQDLLSVVPTASCLVFMFCAPGLVFGCADCFGSRFLILRSRTRFRHYRGHRVPFSRFSLPDIFSTVLRGVGSHFHVLRSQTRFRRYRGRQISFSCFARQDSFSTIQWASGPVFLFCTPGLIFGGTEGVRSRFHVLRSQTRFRRYQGRRV